MKKFYIQCVFLAVTVLWLVTFGILVVQIAHQVLAMRQVEIQNQQTRDITASLSRDLLTFTREIKTQSQEVDFLHGLVNVLPEEKGFVRTQRAISDEVEALRGKVGTRLRGDLHILVDTKANKLYLKKGLKLLWAADCSVGKGGMLKDSLTGRRWEFVTPRGQFEIRDKIEKPFWTKPDWAFVEAGEPVPPPGDPKRQIEGELGGYVFNLGDGYLIHGTKTEALLGRPVSHGCVRLGAEDLKRLYQTVPRWTRVYIY